MKFMDLYPGLIRLHILHHAAREPVYGVGLMEELARHDYKMSPGTLYPILHALEQEGYLRSAEEPGGSHPRRVYRATPAGRRALDDGRRRVKQLFGELFEEERRGR